MVHYFFLFGFITFLYLYVSYKKKKIINLVFFLYISHGLIMVFLNALNLSLEGVYAVHSGDIIQIVYFYLEFIGFSLIELYYKPKDRSAKIHFRRHKMHLEINRTKRKFTNKYFILSLFVLVLIFVVLNFDTLKLAFVNPRMFYAETRIGGGLIYYVFIPVLELIYFIFICIIDYRQKYSLLLSLFATGIIFISLYFFGQKSSLLKIALLFLATYYYKNNSRKKNITVIRLGLILVVAIAIVFVLYSFQQNVVFNNLLYNLSNYSDYLRNFNRLVDNLEVHYYGKMFLEDELFSYIPRFLWSNKPTLFGSLSLGLNVPGLVEWTKALTGAPSFGPLGQSYADFGILCIPITLIVQYFFALMAKKYEIKLNKRFEFYDLFRYLTFCGVLIFSITLTTFPIYQLLAIYVIELLNNRNNKKRMKVRRMKIENFNQCTHSFE